MKNHSTSDNLQHNKSIVPKFNHKECEIMLGPHLVMDTLNGQFVISIELDN
jgi:hypothetical protein